MATGGREIDTEGENSMKIDIVGVDLNFTYNAHKLAITRVESKPHEKQILYCVDSMKPRGVDSSLQLIANTKRSRKGSFEEVKHYEIRDSQQLFLVD